MMNRRTFVGAMSLVAAAGGLGLGGTLFVRRRLNTGQIVAESVRPLQDAPCAFHQFHVTLGQGFVDQGGGPPMPEMMFLM